MSADRRVVRATADFFVDLDRQLPPERSDRVLVVPRMSIVGQLAPDDGVELVQLDLDLDLEAEWA